LSSVVDHENSRFQTAENKNSFMSTQTFILIEQIKLKTGEQAHFDCDFVI
jgi:hypothetical protein